MTRHELEMLESDFDELSRHEGVPIRQTRPRRAASQCPRQRRTHSVPLGIQGRGGKRSTFPSHVRGKVRSIPVLASNNKSPHSSPATNFST